MRAMFWHVLLGLLAGWGVSSWGIVRGGSQPSGSSGSHRINIISRCCSKVLRHAESISKQKSNVVV